MIRHWLHYAIALSIIPGIFASSTTSAQETAEGRAIVTALPRSNESAATIPQESISVTAGGKRQQVSEWVPLRGARSGLQLALLLDDSSRASLGVRLDDVRSFVGALPPGTQIAIGYMRNGIANLVQPFTTDHAAAAKSLRLPIGSPGVDASPYFCLRDLIKRWPQGGDVRREVIMITDGIDRYSGRAFDPQDPYLQAAIHDAQKAGVIVYSIYFRGAGGLDRSLVATDGGQNYLMMLSQDTGGQAYYEGFGNPVSFAPFLSDIQRKLQNQYELGFIAAPTKDLVPMRVKTNAPNTKLLAPAQVMVRTAPVQ